MACPWECNCRSDSARVHVGNRGPGHDPEPFDWSLFWFLVLAAIVGVVIALALL